MGEDRLLYPKSKFRFHLTKLRKVEDEDGKERFAVVSSEIIPGNGKKFRESLYGTSAHIEVVTEKPERFKLNQIYMLATRDVVWLWAEEA
jgi:hypothetical protein